MTDGVVVDGDGDGGYVVQCGDNDGDVYDVD